MEGHYANAVGDAPGQNQANLDRAVLYVGYKFNDWIVWNSEIEFENGTTEKNGSVSVEFATLDFLLDPRFEPARRRAVDPDGHRERGARAAASTTPCSGRRPSR